MEHHELHQDFLLNSRNQWRQQVQELPDDDPARLPIGFVEIALSIVGLDQPLTTDVLSLAFANSVTGWCPIDIGDTIALPDGFDIWRGDPSNEYVRSFADYDYWHVQQDGRVYIRRGYTEDRESSLNRFNNETAGSILEIGYSIVFVGHMLMLAADISDLCGKNLDVVVTYCFSGLRGRQLDFIDGWSLEGNYECGVDTYCHPPEVRMVRQIRNDLSHVLYELMEPLFTSFVGYGLHKTTTEFFVDNRIFPNAIADSTAEV